MPWYGYMYHCNSSLAFPSTFTPCNDAALGAGPSAAQHCLVGTLQHENEEASTAVNWWQMHDLLTGSPHFPKEARCKRHWSEEYSTPYVNCPKGVGPFVPAPTVTSDWSQIWYEDLNSTKIKVKAAKAAKLGGIGVFTGESVGRNQEMWDALAEIQSIAPLEA